MEDLKLFGVELQRQSGSLSCEALQLLDEVPSLRQRDAAAPPSHLDARLRSGLLPDQGDQAVVLDFCLATWQKEKKKKLFLTVIAKE